VIARLKEKTSFSEKSFQWYLIRLTLGWQARG